MNAEPARALDRAQPRSVVRPLSRAADRRCSRPGCPTPARTTLTFQYGERRAVLAPLAEDSNPEAYDLCAEHADRTHPPHGWTLEDERPEDPGAAPDPDMLGSERTVAVLAAALQRDEPPAPTDDGVDTAALDAIVDQPIDDVDLLGTVDESDALPAPEDTEVDPDVSSSALDELAALSGEDDDLPPARTVPAAHRPD